MLQQPHGHRISSPCSLTARAWPPRALAVGSRHADRKDEPDREDRAGGSLPASPTRVVFVLAIFHLKGPFPELLNCRKWYCTPLLSKSSGPAPSGPKGKVAYTTLYDQLSKCFKAVSIRGSSMTHLPRSSGAKSLEQKGVSEDQIR